VIWDPQIGRSSRDWPRMRTASTFGCAQTPSRESDLGRHLADEMHDVPAMWRDVTVQIAANPQAEFAYFQLWLEMTLMASRLYLSPVLELKVQGMSTLLSE